LRLVVQPISHAQSWCVRYRLKGGRTRKLTLRGPSLAEARRQADDAMALLKAGTDPAVAKLDAAKLAAQAEAAHKANTVEQLIARFTAQHIEKNTRPATQAQARHVFNHIVLPKWQGRPIAEIKRRDVIALLDDVAEERGGVMANRTKGYLSRLFRWLCAKDVIEASPVIGVERPVKEIARDRVLTDSEIKALWNACGEIGEVAGACVRLLLLLGQRRSEIGGMRRSEIEGDTWCVPKERMKGGLAHVVPLPALAIEIIKAVPQIGDSDLIFTINGLAS
jgi:integrase